MKKYILFLLLLFVVACSNDNVSSSEQGKGDIEKEEKNAPANKDTRTEEEIEREGRLAEVGDIAEDELGKVELLNIANINEVIEHGPLEIDFVNAKIIKWSDMPSDILNEVSRFGDVTDGEFDYLQIKMIVENTSDEDISWYGIDNLVTDKKQQIDGVSEEFLGNYVDSDYLGNVKKEYVLGYILNDSDIKDLRIVFSYVDELNTYERIAEKLDYELNFE
ncbi:hypothetical protein [Gracilibacillus lacisalsi]|uniref:hypothetical protein n=1 Tax=Gracilibacillus lacisalsi TaxID=393087 RepID=UPI0003813485|nr:hypothetical protein [Gracilibacillus lacisalsi]